MTTRNPSIIYLVMVLIMLYFISSFVWMFLTFVRVLYYCLATVAIQARLGVYICPKYQTYDVML